MVAVDLPEMRRMIIRAEDESEVGSISENGVVMVGQYPGLLRLAVPEDDAIAMTTYVIYKNGWPSWPRRDTPEVGHIEDVTPAIASERCHAVFVKKWPLPDAVGEPTEHLADHFETVAYFTYLALHENWPPTIVTRAFQYYECLDCTHPLELHAQTKVPGQREPIYGACRMCEACKHGRKSGAIEDGSRG